MTAPLAQEAPAALRVISPVLTPLSLTIDIIDIIEFIAFIDQTAETDTERIEYTYYNNI